MGRKKVLIAFAVILCLIGICGDFASPGSLHHHRQSDPGCGHEKRKSVGISQDDRASHHKDVALQRVKFLTHADKIGEILFFEIVELLYPSADRPYSRGVLHQYFDAEFCGKSDLCQRNLR